MLEPYLGDLGMLKAKMMSVLPNWLEFLSYFMICDVILPKNYVFATRGRCIADMLQ